MISKATSCYLAPELQEYSEHHVNLNKTRNFWAKDKLRSMYQHALFEMSESLRELQRAWGNTYARAVRGRGNLPEMPPGQMQMRCAMCSRWWKRVFASSPRSEGCKDSQDLLIPLISSQILKSHRCQEKHIQSENNWERVSLLRILRRSSSLDQHGRRHRRCFSGEESQNWMLHLYAKMKISRSSASISIIFLHCTFLHTVEQICTFTSVRSVQMRVTWVRLKYYTAYRNSFNENLLRPSLQRHVSSTLSHCQSCFAHSWHVQAETGGAGIFAVATVEVPLCHYAFIQCLEVVILLRLQEALHIIASFLRENVAAV